MVERARLARGGAPACPPAPRVRSLIRRRRRPQTTSSRFPSILFRPRSRARACTRERIPLSAALVGGVEDGWMELKAVEQTVSASVHSTSFARPSVPPPQHLAGSCVMSLCRCWSSSTPKGSLSRGLSSWSQRGPWCRKLRPLARKGEMRLHV